MTHPPPKVGIVMGSDSDLPAMQKAIDLLRTLGVPAEVRVLSAHRTPDAVAEWSAAAEGRGMRVLIAAAGGAAHLAGAVAARTRLPVIGIPIASEPFHGLDALLSTVQMPPGVPVATVAAGPFGPVNAALLAARILALDDALLRTRLQSDLDERAKKTLDADGKLFSPSAP